MYSLLTRWTRVISRDGGWEAIYKDGQLVAQGFSVTASQLLHALGIPVETINDIELPIPWPEFIDLNDAYTPKHRHS